VIDELVSNGVVEEKAASRVKPAVEIPVALSDKIEEIVSSSTTTPAAITEKAAAEPVKEAAASIPSAIPMQSDSFKPSSRSVSSSSPAASIMHIFSYLAFPAILIATVVGTHQGTVSFDMVKEISADFTHGINKLNSAHFPTDRITNSIKSVEETLQNTYHSIEGIHATYESSLKGLQGSYEELKSGIVNVGTETFNAGKLTFDDISKNIKTEMDKIRNFDFFHWKVRASPFFLDNFSLTHNARVLRKCSSGWQELNDVAKSVQQKIHFIPTLPKDTTFVLRLVL